MPYYINQSIMGESAGHNYGQVEVLYSMYYIYIVFSV